MGIITIIFLSLDAYYVHPFWFCRKNWYDFHSVALIYVFHMCVSFWSLIVLVQQGWWCSSTFESCGAYFFVSLDSLSCCDHSPAYHFGLFLAISYNSSSERCISIVANICYLWDLVCFILASGSVSKMVSHQSWDLPWQASFEVCSITFTT